MKHRPCKRLCSRLYLSYRRMKVALNPAKKFPRPLCPEREGLATAYAHRGAVFVLGVSMEIKKADTITSHDTCNIREVVVCDKGFNKIVEFTKADGKIIMSFGGDKIEFDECRFSEFIIKLSNLDWGF